MEDRRATEVVRAILRHQVNGGHRSPLAASRADQEGKAPLHRRTEQRVNGSTSFRKSCNVRKRSEATVERDCHNRVRCRVGGSQQHSRIWGHAYCLQKRGNCPGERFASGPFFIAKVQPCVDAKGLLRVGRRIEAADVPFDVRNPLILPS